MPFRRPPREQTYWIYKRGVLVLVVRNVSGVFISTRGVDDNEPNKLACGKYFSTEWEPRVRALLERASSFRDFLSQLEDRNYLYETSAPSTKTHPMVRM